MTRTDDDRVVHILDAIELIGRWTAEHPHDDIYRWLAPGEPSTSGGRISTQASG
jgi:hypothetical protein